jgi:uncharacterized membrane protein
MKPNTYAAIALLLLLVLIYGIIGGMDCGTLKIGQGMLMAVPVLAGAGWCTYKAGEYYEKD